MEADQKQIIQVILWVVGMAIVMTWLAKSRKETDEGEISSSLKYPKSILALALVGIAFFGLVEIATVIYVEDSPVSSHIILAGMLLLSIYLLAEYMRVEYLLSDEGIEFQTLFKRRSRIFWSEISRVKYSRQMKWLVIETSSGRALRISSMVRGLPELAKQILDRVPNAEVDEPAKVVLQNAMHGKLPSIWM